MKVTGRLVGLTVTITDVISLMSEPRGRTARTVHDRLAGSHHSSSIEFVDSSWRLGRYNARRRRGSPSGSLAARLTDLHRSRLSRGL